MKTTSSKMALKPYLETVSGHRERLSQEELTQPSWSLLRAFRWERVENPWARSELSRLISPPQSGKATPAGLEERENGTEILRTALA